MRATNIPPICLLAFWFGIQVMGSASQVQSPDRLACGSVGTGVNSAAVALGQFKTTSITFSVNASGDGTFDYQGSKPIAELLVLSAYTLADTHAEFSILYHDALPKSLLPNGVSPMTEFYGRRFPLVVGGMKKPLLSGTVIRLLGEGPEVVDSCPASSRTTFMHLVYTDGTSSDYNPGDWELAPQLIEARSPVNFPTSLVPQSRHLIASARILANGSVEDLSFEHPETASDLLIENIRSNSRTWKFLPAVDHGSAVESTIPLEIRFRNVNSDLGVVLPDKLLSGRAFLIVDFEGLAENGTWQISSAGKLTRAMKQ
jgi:hypothetical protein